MFGKLLDNIRSEIKLFRFLLKIYCQLQNLFFVVFVSKPRKERNISMVFLHKIFLNRAQSVQKICKNVDVGHILHFSMFYQIWSF